MVFIFRARLAAQSKSVDDKYKFTYGELTPGVRAPAADMVAKQGDPLYLQPHTILITKEGVIQLIMKSKLPYPCCRHGGKTGRSVVLAATYNTYY
ncbi:baculovirus repeated namegeneORF [Condylorrhiza vestigialis mutiple nucleopolyhedrovirus]|uniref:Baculovirus repeated namegeneORF n=1 Tax=Condylorrhiza vestigialis mutiple nucleopolyhedrovirus TaxID=1592576 RepID=A0A0B4UL64_9ABAC|nr:baculovirus repeated namegeneORF [Condylorrhiza vestigialis mutiple nucleopolyhedrovirus]AJD09247.1 baculovirus repeated namegeneORF [Condylorrhiza vestigialis mutiple nucleopolyhedrovirus]